MFLAVVVVLLYVFAYHRIFAITFDESFARSVGVKTKVYDAVFALVCSAVVVLGMRLLGSLLISSLVIFPTLSAMRLFRTFRGVVVGSAVISIVAFVVGLVLSYILTTPTGATVVLANLALFLATVLASRVFGK
jgi:zinc transport system permease protein